MVTISFHLQTWEAFLLLLFTNPCLYCHGFMRNLQLTSPCIMVMGCIIYVHIGRLNCSEADQSPHRTMPLLPSVSISMHTMYIIQNIPIVFPFRNEWIGQHFHLRRKQRSWCCLHASFYRPCSAELKATFSRQEQ